MINDKKYKKRAMKIAKELCYNKDVIEKIKQATSEIQVHNILASARKRM